MTGWFIRNVEILGCATGRVVKVTADKGSVHNETSDKTYSGKCISIFLKIKRTDYIL
jgi:hypothetical protein